jgi:ATP-dependent Clp protease adaptor protein ClpS
MRNEPITLIEEEIGNQTIEDLLGSTAETKKIVVFNDEVNSFEHVIECFMSYLEHTYEQAEQCAMLIHMKGKYAVKEGSFEELEPYNTALNDAGLSSTIE